MLALSELDAFYGRAQALFGVGFEVAAGQASALLGRNGAGKSTTLKTIMGLISPTAGSIELNGETVAGLSPPAMVRRGVGYVPEDRRIFTRLTVEENLWVGQRPPRGDLPNWSVDRVFALFPALGALQRRSGGQLSGGEQQMLCIARTLMGNPALLLLDEPATGLAPKVAEDLAAAVRELRAEGLTILLSEQSLPFAAAVAETVLVLETGHLRWQGAMSDFLADPDAQHAYLGV